MSDWVAFVVFMTIAGTWVFAPEELGEAAARVVQGYQSQMEKAE